MKNEDAAAISFPIDAQKPWEKHPRKNAHAAAKVRPEVSDG